MPSKRPVTLLRRGRSWALRRAVPREFHGVEPRRVITKTLSATTEAGASKEAQRFWNGLLRQWRRATSGVGAGYLARLDEARQALKKEGLRYIPASQVARLPREELFARIDGVRGPSGEVDLARAQLDLGGIVVPPLTPSTLYEAFVQDFLLEPGPSRSPDQVRRYLSGHRRAVALLVAALGEADLSQVSTDDLRRFAESLVDRLGEWRQTTLNSQLYRLQNVIDRGSFFLRVAPPITVTDMVQRVDQQRTRPAFSRKWIEQRLLAPGALDGLDRQARCLLLGMINTGFRTSEGANLQAAQIRLDTKVPHLVIEPRGRMLKTRFSRRNIPLAGISLRAFQECPDGFPDHRDRPSLSARLNGYLTRAGLRETPAHTVCSLRHGFEQRLIDARTDRRLLCELMGHADGRPNYSRPLPIEMLAEPIHRIALGERGERGRDPA